jgi:hypothetical protein
MAFDKHSSGMFKGCVLAIDSFAVSTQKPFAWEVKRTKDYHFHRGGFVIVVPAGYDVDATFIAASFNQSGNIYDIIAWGDSKLFQMLEL